MEDPVIKVRCWKCKQTFHLRIFPKDHKENHQNVDRLFPCPYCNTDCMVKISADQIAKVEVFRDGIGEAILSLSDLDSLTGKSLSGQIFETCPADK